MGSGTRWMYACMHVCMLCGMVCGIVCYVVWHVCCAACGPRRRIEFNLQQILSHCGADLNSTKNLIATYCGGTHRSPTRGRNEVQQIQLTVCTFLGNTPAYLPPSVSFLCLCLCLLWWQKHCALNFSTFRHKSRRLLVQCRRPFGGSLAPPGWPDLTGAHCHRRSPGLPLSLLLSLSVSTKVLLMACFY